MTDSYNRLVYDIFHDYRKEPPIEAQICELAPQLQLKVTLFYTKLVEVMEKDETIAMIVELKVDWIDSRINWNPKEYGGIEHVFRSHDEVWIPDLTIINANDVRDYREDYQKVVQIYSNGTVQYYMIMLASFVCNYDLRRLPFDKQICNISIVTYNTLIPIKLISSEKLVTLGLGPENALGNGEWRVVNLTKDDKLSNSYDRLLKFIFKDYDVSRAPIEAQRCHLSPLMNMTVMLSYIKVVEVIEKDETMTMITELKIQYTDSRINWNPEEFDGLDYVYVKESDIWIPGHIGNVSDVTVIDADDVKDYREDIQKLAQIFANGTVQFFMYMLTSTVCNYDVTDDLTRETTNALPTESVHICKVIQFGHASNGY
ncbi:hypothetical protein WR25_05992 [Diploscapter pachys]|uniref:Neurotransmitter-gated ion-channel ligand-binding domain-containing protein n=1 Tax=Diploscapter pachys TaxID=2018661 RepID=A0A2A2LQA1_9BILA|nr:hypothetical protein WR25_05992 [Diploscapter pachys]